MTDSSPAAEQSLVVVITGMAGAGRSTAAKALEDLGFYVIDNLPPRLISQVVEIADMADRPSYRLAVAVDSRTGAYTFEELQHEILALHRLGVRAMVVFLDADDQALVKRFQETRRPHPLKGDTLEEAIAAEREILKDLRGTADVLIDTSDLSVHDLRRRLVEAFEAPVPERRMRVSVTSFGFKHGSPRDLDLVFDVRFLPNPHWVPELRPLTGLDAPVADYVLNDESAQEFVNRVADLLEFLVPRYVDEGKAYLRVGVGCTGGRHRSVAIAEELARRLTDANTASSTWHRDVEDGR